jgi:iron complex outermembrane receptor protein
MKFLFFLFSISLFANTLNAQFIVSGQINASGDLLPGANIQILNTNYATSTDAEGKFKFKLAAGNYVLKVSYIGYKTVTHHFSVLNKDEFLNITLYEEAFHLNGLEVFATRVNPNSAMSSSSVDSASIAKNNLGMDLPYMLDQTPSVVVTSDAGNGIGYSGIRIRGSDPTRVNISINGIPVNDAESQGVYWVDFPDLASSANSIEIQRGVGTSSNGAGAFGGTVNILTSNENEKAFGEISNSFGSFNSHKHTLKMGTGKLFKTNNKRTNYFSFDSRLSWIASDGYIDRAFSDLKSFYISGAYVSEKSSLRFVAFSGKEKTYQAWGGVPKDSLETNRTFNPYTYENETDNYIQSNYQLLYNFSISEKLKGNVSMHYTKGAGYYEQFKKSDDIYGDGLFSSYGLDNIIIGSDTITSTDLIRRRWLDNDFYGTVYSILYNLNQKWEFIFGGAYNKYDGNHFGEIIWAQYALNSNINQEYYRDAAQKTDWNNFLKTNYWISKSINAYVDLQIRNVNYQFNGFDRNLNVVNQKSSLLFFNPKFGITAYLPKNQVIYSSFSMANKEPNRDDFTSSSLNSRPKPESMIDLELGYKISSLNFMFNLNFYHMKYKDQLVLTGKINDVGSYTRQNIAESYRQGIELETGFKINQHFNFAMNATLSDNKILNYIEYIDNWDTWDQDSIIHAKTNIAFSPSVIIGATLTYSFKFSSNGNLFFIQPSNRGQNVNSEFNLALIPKYVGKQFIDNTSNTERMLEAYFVCDARITYTRKRTNSGRNLAFNFTLRNLFNELYSSNAWAYTYKSAGQLNSEVGFYPQAGINFLVGLTLGF